MDVKKAEGVIKACDELLEELDMEVKILFCPRCDSINFPEGEEAANSCKCCHLRDLKLVRLEIEEVTA